MTRDRYSSRILRQANDERPPRETGTRYRAPGEPLGPLYGQGVYYGRYDISVHNGRTAPAPQWWTVRLFPQRGPFSDGGPSPAPQNTATGDAWARIECGVEGPSGTIVCSWPMSTVAEFCVWGSSVSVAAMLSATDMSPRLAFGGPRFVCAIVDGASPRPLGGRWNVTVRPDELELGLIAISPTVRLLAIPPLARSYRIANRAVSPLTSTVLLSQTDYSSPSVGAVVRQVDKPLIHSNAVNAIAARICDSATHIQIDYTGVDPSITPGVYDVCFDLSTGHPEAL